MSTTSDHYKDLRRRVGDAVYDALLQSSGPDAERLTQAVGDLSISEYRRRVDRLIAALDEPVADDDNGQAFYLVREQLPGDDGEYSTIIRADPEAVYDLAALAQTYLQRAEIAEALLAQRTATIPGCVSELAWHVVGASRPHESLHSAQALRRGEDEWVVWDGFQPPTFLHYLNRSGEDLWVWDPPRGPGGRKPARYDLDTLTRIVPTVLLHEARRPDGQFAHIADLTVIAGYLPERAPTEGATTP